MTHASKAGKLANSKPQPSSNSSILEYVRAAKQSATFSSLRADHKWNVHKRASHIDQLKKEFKKAQKQLQQICIKEEEEDRDEKPHRSLSPPLIPHRTPSFDAEIEEDEEPSQVMKLRATETSLHPDQSYSVPEIYKTSEAFRSPSRKAKGEEARPKVRPSVNKQLSDARPSGKEPKESQPPLNSKDKARASNEKALRPSFLPQPPPPESAAGKGSLTNYIQTKVDRLNEFTHMQREMINHTHISRLESLNKKKIVVLHTTKIKPAQKSLRNLSLPKNSCDNVHAPLTAKQTHTEVPPHLDLSPQPTITPPHHKDGIKDYKLNNMFKMIEFLENDENLENRKNNYRERLKEFKKTASLGPTKELHRTVVKEYTDHEKLKEYSIGKDLGQGSFALVKLVTKLSTGIKYAMKIYEISKNNTEELKKNLQNETQLLKNLNHPNIIKLHDWFEGNWFIYLILEYVGPVSLMEYLEQHPSSFLTEEEGAHLFHEVAKGLEYLHKQNIYHRDIKLNNILLGSQGEVKLIDFGFSLKLKEDKKISAFCGTPSYMAPEVLSRLPHCPEKGDVWSFGICLYRALAGQFPFRGISQENLFHMIKKGNITMLGGMSDEAQQLIRLLLNKKASSRPTMTQVLQHEWFKKYINESTKDSLQL